MSNILDKSALDRKDYNDPNSVLYRGGLLNNPNPQSRNSNINNNPSSNGDFYYLGKKIEEIKKIGL